MLAFDQKVAEVLLFQISYYSLHEIYYLSNAKWTKLDDAFSFWWNFDDEIRINFSLASCAAIILPN